MQSSNMMELFQVLLCFLQSETPDNISNAEDKDTRIISPRQLEENTSRQWRKTHKTQFHFDAATNPAMDEIDGQIASEFLVLYYS